MAWKSVRFLSKNMVRIWSRLAARLSRGSFVLIPWPEVYEGHHAPLQMSMTRSVFEQIRRMIGSQPAEQGGPLGGSRETGVVSHFYFDDSANRSRTTYSPDHNLLNKLFAEEWNPAGINLLGFVHSHPGKYRCPSAGDVVYARNILKHIPELKRLFLPIVMTEPDTGQFRIFPYAAERRGDDIHLRKAELVVVDEETNAMTEKQASHVYHFDGRETFRRVASAYDLERLAKSRVIYIGVGGAAGFIEDMARAGVGEHVLIDPDIVSEANLATQQVYRRDIGRPKVDCIAERIRDINPKALVITRQKSLDEIDDAEFERLALASDDRRRPAQTLICGLTDNFEAQARVNRLALQFGLPSLCAQVYHEGRAAEITFTYPGVTPACHRCVLSSRYKAYLTENFKNNVTSDGTPIFATTRLNALKGFIAMAILHHGVNHQLSKEAQLLKAHEQPAHKRFGKLLEQIGNRNLIQIRMEPELGLSLGLKVFDQVFSGGDRRRILFDDVVWLPQQQDCPANGYPHCLDCGGTGDLLDAVGTFSDTRLMRN